MQFLGIIRYRRDPGLSPDNIAIPAFSLFLTIGVEKFAQKPRVRRRGATAPSSSALLSAVRQDD